MKSLITFTLLGLLLFSCKEQAAEKTKKTTPSVQTELSSLDWLVGNWERANDEPGNYTFETWEKEAPMIYKGMGVTVKDGDTIFQENMRIELISDVYNLEVGGTNGKAVNFQFTNQTKTSFICENPKHDFPTKIEYRLENDSIKAAVSGQGHKIDFVFKKVN